LPSSKLTQRQAAIQHGWRSGLEEKIAEQLQGAGVSYQYEALTLRYLVEEERKYTPDFILSNGIVVESKGHFVTADRKKMKLVKAQHPALDIRFVFSNPNSRISKTSKTTYGKWATDHGFPSAARLIPVEWLHEPPNPRAIAALRSLGFST
jgi:hypothetical protein